MKSQIIIPARLASSRLPEKLLLCETGQTLLEHTWHSASRAHKPTGIVVACDHLRIAEAVADFGGTAVMTNPNAASGTDRIAEVAAGMPEVDIFVNVQGDEPDIPGDAIDLAVTLLEENPEVAMTTLATPIRNRVQLEDPACVKVVFGGDQKAHYFSRSVVPHPREWNDSLLTATPALFHQHVGLYAYRREVLLTLAKLPQTSNEKTENLEQLRALDNGFSICVGVIEAPIFGIDTPEDYAKFCASCEQDCKG